MEEELDYLVNVVEMRLHALDGDVLACLDRLGLQHFRKSTLSFLTDESVF